MHGEVFLWHVQAVRRWCELNISFRSCEIGDSVTQCLFHYRPLRCSIIAMDVESVGMCRFARNLSNMIQLLHLVSIFMILLAAGSFFLFCPFLKCWYPNVIYFTYMVAKAYCTVPFLVLMHTYDTGSGGKKTSSIVTSAVSFISWCE